ncbi:MAG TPA: NADH-quinone oxidoreductase subunit A [Chloroflexota bacterium]|jgi:NADH-quinone oxidoreductase subunit A|nr:NADH-quinone oxidoreductase subunit A [Chloroflexota bacterium]
MLKEYVYVLILLALAAGLAGLLLSLTFILGPKRPTAQKLAPYESGMRDIEPPARRFPIKFYVVAMLFLLFDIESISFFPWAVILRRLRFFGFLEMLVFIVVLLIGYVYAWRKGALDWQ